MFCIMARNTTRDQIWNAALEILDETAIDEWFRPADVQSRLDSKVSDRTLRDTLNSMWEMGHLDRKGGHGPVQAWYGHVYEPDERDDQDGADHSGHRADGSTSIYWCRYCETATLADERPDKCEDCGVEGSGLDDLGLVSEAGSSDDGPGRMTVCRECPTVWDGLSSHCRDCGNEAVHQIEPRPLD
jgi:hypothetical protein